MQSKHTLKHLPALCSSVGHAWRLSNVNVPAGGATEQICAFIQTNYSLCWCKTSPAAWYRLFKVCSILSQPLCQSLTLSQRHCDLFSKMTFKPLFYLLSSLLHIVLDSPDLTSDAFFLSAVQFITLAGYLYSFGTQLECICSLIIVAVI